MIRHTLAGIAAVCAFAGCTPEPPPADTWAFCGTHPDDPAAAAKISTLARSAGIDATFGPCLPPDWATYTTAEPGQRYADVDTYARLTDMNAAAGMQTVVYDPRIWSTDPAARAAAVTYWQPRLEHVAAWDMGDEFDPDGADWDVLVTRWNTVTAHVEPVTGVRPFTNHLWWALDRALADMPTQRDRLSFDLYDVPASLAIAERYDDRTRHLTCSINALDHGQYRLTAWGIETAMHDHADAGCDSFLIFGGDMPYNTDGFGLPSLVNPDGTATRYAAAVLRGAE